jgi:hypothetical protein
MRGMAKSKDRNDLRLVVGEQHGRRLLPEERQSVAFVGRVSSASVSNEAGASTWASDDVKAGSSIGVGFRERRESRSMIIS